MNAGSSPAPNVPADNTAHTMKRPDNSVNRHGCKSFNEKRNDKPRIQESSWGHLKKSFRRGYPPRPLVEPMHQGHWSTVDDYVDVGELADE